MTFKEFANDRQDWIRECDCGAGEFEAHPRNCAKTVSWDRVFEGWRQSGVTIHEAGICTPDFERKAAEFLNRR